MQTVPKAPRLAVLIDGDNVAAKHADFIFERVAELGNAFIRRVYGNVALSGAKGWAPAIARHAIQSHQHFPVSPSKNAADIALAIDAMDILRDGVADAFCIASSDCDFTPLVIRIREAGRDVFGFGHQAANGGYKAGCRKYFVLDDDMAVPPSLEPVKAVVPGSVLPRLVLEKILRALKDHRASDGWMDLALLGTILAKSDPPILARNHGAASMGELLKRQKGFEFETSQPGRLRIRKKVPG